MDTKSSQLSLIELNWQNFPIVFLKEKPKGKKGDGEKLLVLQ